ncbi:MAG TPA: DegQ family serine endoprotease [Burkholderiales bacterium]|nr:DegQ family serine endoprotease [Burkholderiales bacterium]
MRRNLLLLFTLWIGIAASAPALAAPAGLPDFTDLVEKQGPAVVNISGTQTVRHGPVPQLPNVPEDDPFYEFFKKFAPPGGGQAPREFESKSLGSGFIISGDGYVITNAHVVDQADEVVVKLTDKREFKAKVVGSDKKTDVAVLKIEAAGLPKVSLGDPNKLKVGEWVLAIGAPFGFENSVTAGIVSAKGRSLPQENYVPFIQTDVAINPGNSGGPLFNLKGEVVGVNSQIYSRTGGFMGLSFAIPIDVAMDIVNQLRTTGKVSRGRIGVVIQEVTKELAESFGLPKAVGALVNSVEKGGPAEKAGIEPSDVIIKFDGKNVNSSADLPRIVGATKPGTRVTLQVWRKGAAKELQVTVGEMPADEQVAQKGGGKRPKGESSVASTRLGVQASDLTAEQKKELKLEGGVLVEDVQAGSGARAGLRPGDVILAVNNDDVKGVEHLGQLLSKFEKGRTVALLVRRGDSTSFMTIKLDGAK